MPRSPGGYLFATFKGEQWPMGEHVSFVMSRDGKRWTSLNRGEPVLVSAIGGCGARDPFLLRSHDGGKFILLATDGSIVNLNDDWKRAVTAGSKSILIWESRDLVHWCAPRLVEVAPDDAGCTWAPEAVYDKARKSYLVFWAGTNARDGFSKQRIWAARTRDFITFGEPFVFIDKPCEVIDTTIVFENGLYFRFSKDETNKSITQELSETLDGPWTEVPNFSLAQLTGVEGPACFPLADSEPGKPAKWCLMLDHYARGEGYKPFITKDLSSGRFEPASDVTFPFKLRHGSVLRISAEEIDRLEAAFS